MKAEPETSPDASLVPIARERHQAGLLRYAQRLLGGDPVRAREVVDGVFEELKSQPAEIEDELAEWLFAACRRRAVGLMGHDGRGGRLEGDSQDQASDAAEPAGETGEGEDPVATMQRLFERLTPKQQEALRLKFVEGFTLKEIARITDLGGSSVGILVHNAVARLARETAAQRDAAAEGERPARGPDDPRYSLYALNEMEDSERKAFENSLYDRKAAAARIDELRSVAALVEKVLALEAGGATPRPKRRKKSRRGGGAWLRFPRILLPIGLVGLIGAAAWYFLRNRSESDQPAVASSSPDFRLKAAPWEIKPGADAAADLRPVGGNGGAGGSSSGGSAAHGRFPVHAAGQTSSPGTAGPHLENVETATDDESDSGPVNKEVSATARGRSGAIARVPEAERNEGDAGGEVASEEPARPEVGPEAAPPGGEKPMAPETPAPKKDEIRNSGAVKKAPPAEREKRKFSSAAESPASQLPTDVDGPGMLDLKRWLGTGRLPAPGAVRVGDMLNYFPYHYAPPEAPDDFAVTVESAEAPWASAHRLVRVAIKARQARNPARATANLVLLIDTSGSMAAPNRLPLVKEAARLLVTHLQPDDRVGIVTYAGESRLTLAPTRVAEAKKIFAALDPLEASGQTNGGAGIELAYDLAAAHVVKEGINAVVLCTDGDFNAGATSADELIRLVDRQAGTGVQLSIFGFGRNGRIDPRLEALAAHGRGASGYVNTRGEAEQVLRATVNGATEAVAANLQAEVVFNPACVSGYRLIGFEDANSELKEKSAADLDARGVAPGQELTAMYEIVPVAGAAKDAEALKVQLRYQEKAGGPNRECQYPFREHGGSFAQASLDFKFAAAVAAFGTMLRESPQPDPMLLDRIEAWGRESLGDDVGGYRSEFLALVEQARHLH